MKNTKLLIGGQWRSAVNEETIPVVAPADGEVFATIPRGQSEDIDLAVTAARRALDGAWGRLTATERGRLLTRLSQKVLDHAEELAQIEARDAGNNRT